jgi:nucleoid DNA-binding protein
MSSVIIKAVLKYLESNPDAVEKLVEALVKKLIEELTKKDSTN